MDELKLNQNDLTEVSDVSFVMDALPRLRLLDLSNNDIRDIPFGALRGYPALERLFLASNQRQDEERISSAHFHIAFFLVVMSLCGALNCNAMCAVN